MILIWRDCSNKQRITKEISSSLVVDGGLRVLVVAPAHPRGGLGHGGRWLRRGLQGAVGRCCSDGLTQALSSPVEAGHRCGSPWRMSGWGHLDRVLQGTSQICSWFPLDFRLRLWGWKGLWLKCYIKWWVRWVKHTRLSSCGKKA